MLFAKCKLDVIKMRIFMRFRTVPIKDFVYFCSNFALFGFSKRNCTRQGYRGSARRVRGSTMR